ncbi:hypothetical protein [Streptomyces sp. HPF1205]|uniref:hypothetical protein n=1 Tax=Streptomyces sp. HPF1205 TaxID=2873262 RepID=UPI001CEDEFAB|nr:hypothetical protein [Streptomyces sp. HPF1205]
MKRLILAIAGLLGATLVVAAPSIAEAAPASPSRTMVQVASGPSHGGRASVTPAALSAIVCGGSKYGSGWATYGTGGYVGQGCGAGIDYHATPTGGATSTYNLGTTDGGTHYFDAWIPTVYATANMDFSLYVCGSEVLDATVNEANFSGWLRLYGVSGYAGCSITITAWSGMASSGAYVGLDAIRVAS